MQFILENYLLIILIGLFFVFALIGYLIDMLRKENDESKSNDKEDIKSVNIAKLDDIKEESKDKKADDSDELLKNYEEDKTEDITNKNV